MSYGKEFKIDGQVYLLEIFEKHVYVAKKNDDENYSKIYEGDYTSLFWDEELKQFKKLKHEVSLYAITVKCLNRHGIINSEALYQKFIYEMLEHEHSKEEILNSDSDEVLVYELHFPLDYKRENFQSFTSAIIDGYPHR